MRKFFFCESLSYVTVLNEGTLGIYKILSARAEAEVEHLVLRILINLRNIINLHYQSFKD